MKCGHSEPSDEKTAFKATSNEDFILEYSLKLDDINKATLNIQSEEHVRIINHLFFK